MDRINQANKDALLKDKEADGEADATKKKN
jgi:hypothetical protein